MPLPFYERQSRPHWLFQRFGARSHAILLMLLLSCQGLVSGPGGSVAGSNGTGGGNGSGPGVGSGFPVPGTTMTAGELAELYFPGNDSQLPKKRLARLTRGQLDETARVLLPGHVKASLLATFPKDPLQTNYEYADNLQVGASNFTPYAKWVADIAASVKSNPKSVINCGVSDTACQRTEAGAFLTKAFRGTASAARITAFIDAYMSGIAAVGFEEATADLVDTAMTSPTFVFRDEVSVDATGTLFPAQRLQALTYVLADNAPDALSLPSANPAPLVETPAATAATIDQILATPQARKKLAGFFNAWLEIREPQEFTISTSVFPEFTAALTAAMLEETTKFLTLKLSQTAPKLKDITQATQSIVSDELRAIYGNAQSTGNAPVSLDATQRLGILTHPAMLASHSGPTTTRLVKRGVFFTRKMMCIDLSPPPQGTDTTVPDTKGMTERARIETVTSIPKCQGCHNSINPFGFMQENYDAIGRWRTLDEGLPIDAKVSIDFLEDGAVTASTPVDALKALTNSARFKQCFVRQLFRYYQGREETPADAPLLRQMFIQFINNDEQDIVQQLQLLSNSARFTQRVEAP
jgi:Protein of unknown function (DUF1588)/Protein of unknown function (DUF1592)/Protein of unknown function (DUF1585)